MSLNSIEQDEIVYSLDEIKGTASVISSNIMVNFDVIIPRSINYQSKEYIVTSISKEAFDEQNPIVSIQFANDSEMQSIESDAFNYSSIECIEIPSNLIELKEGWCNNTKKLTQIKVCPNNPKYAVYNDIFIIGKSSIEQENYDILVFCVRNVKTVVIPDFIEIIGPFAFDYCKQIDFFEIPSNSNLRIIDKFAFSVSSINNITIPPKLIELKEGWCNNTTKLTKINVMPDNPRFSLFDNKFIIGKSSIEQEKYDVLVFSVRDIEIAVIPDFIEIIGPFSFDFCLKLKSVEFSTNSMLRIIDMCAFQFSTIEKISIPSHLTKINKNAFSVTKKLQSIEIPIDSELQFVDSLVFSNSSIRSITIPPTLIELHKNWCCRTKLLTEIKVMPNNPRYKLYDDKLIIGKSTLEQENYDILVFGVRNIETVTIPSFIREIGPYAFENCKKLQNIEIPQDSKLEVISKYAFAKTLFKNINLPYNITKIGTGAFFICDKLQNVNIQMNSKLQIIKMNAFNETSLKSFAVPPHLKKISEKTFQDCIHLSKIEIPKDSELETIENAAFECTSIEIIKIPIHLIKIDEKAFYSCEKLRKIEIPMNCDLQIIGRYSLSYTSIESITISSNVVETEYGWCENTPNLNKIAVSPDNPFYSCYDDKFILKKSSIDQMNYNVLVLCVRDVENVVIPDFIEIIGSFAFNRCDKLRAVDISQTSNLKVIDKYAFGDSSIESINIPPKLDLISEGAFLKCNKLINVGIPTNSELRIIGEYSFKESSITNFFIPSHLIQISAYAFYACQNLEHVEIPSDSNLQSIGFSAFGETLIDSIRIPSKLVELENGFCDLNCTINEIYVDENNSHFQLYDNKFIIGKSSLDSENFNVLFFCVRNIEVAIIPSFIEIIKTQAFGLCNQLKTIEIPFDSCLRVIEKNAFFGSPIESLTIPSNLIELNNGWCEYTYKLTDIIVSPSNKHFIFLDNKYIVGKSNEDDKIYDTLVFSRRNIKIATIPSFIKKIGSFSFNGCFQLQQINILKSSKLNTIDMFAFLNSSIECIHIPRHLKIIDEGAFNYCNNLKYVDFQPNSELTIIGKDAFSSSSIESIWIPSQINLICDGAFSSCDHLQIIEINDFFEIDFKNVFKSSNPLIMVSAHLIEFIPNRFD